MARIVVTPAEEDEVIVAGAASGSGAVPAPGSDPAAEPGRAPEPERQPGSEPHSAPDPHHGSKPAPAGDGSYREATLDDLEPQPMPLAQRIVLIAAVVCIIGAVIYYFVAMR